MTDSLRKVLPEQLSKVIAASMGLHFAPERLPDLMRGIGAAAHEFGFEDAESCALWLCSARLDKRQVEILASHLTVGETYFFREQRGFEILAEEILPKLILMRRSEGRRLRIWSAGCCTGEEPYSLAMTLARLLPDISDWDITLLATDINPRFLQKAAAGVFGEWSFRSTSPELKERFFTPAANGRMELRREIRKMVSFEYLNLAEDAFPSLLNNTNAMDLVMCRNVMIYMTPLRIERLVEKFSHCLRDDAWLLVGAAETSFVRPGELKTVSFPGIVAFQKTRAVSEQPAFPRKRLQATPPADTAVEALADAAALFEQGRYADVLLRLQPIASRLNPPASVLGLMARAHANQGKLAAALEMSERAINADKMNPSFHYLRGSMLQEMADLAGAAASFNRAIYLDPRFIMAHFALAHLARHQGQSAQMARHFANALELLHGRSRDEPVPDSDGMAVGRLAEIISTIVDGGMSA